MTPGAEPRDTLAGLRDAADRVLALLHDVPAGDPATRIARRRAWRLATDLRTRASEPVCVAIVGGSSASTTELASALLGRPGLPGFPPAADQVTAIRVGPAAARTGAGLPAVSVTYLSRREAARAARFMLGRLIGFVRREELCCDMTGLTEDPVADDFRAFEEAARSWWAGDGDRLAGLRARAWQLLLLRNALAAGGDLLDDEGPGRPVPVDPAALGAAPGTGGPPGVPRAFPELPDDPPVPRGTRLTAEVLGRTYPLIGRITWRAGLPPGAWDPGGLPDAGVLVIGLPGLGTGDSRAEYLCREELRTATTVVEVLNAAPPAAAAARMVAAARESRRRSAGHLDEPVLTAANGLDDDGIARLRGLITRHAADALRAEARDLLRLGADLLEALGLLRALARPGPGRPPGEAARGLADLVDGLSGAAAVLRAAAARFRDPQELMVAGGDGAPVGLLTRIGQEAVLEVYRWPVWDALLAQVRDGQVRFPPAVGRDEAGDLGDCFDRALTELRSTARRLAGMALADWVREHDRHVAGVRAQLRDPGILRPLAASLAVLDAHDQGDMRLQQLGRIVDLGWVPGQFARALDHVEDRAAAAGASAVPLAWRALPRHPADDQAGDPRHVSRRHHSAVHRLRHDLAEGLAFPVRAAVATAFGDLAVRLEAEFRTLLGRIPVQTELLAPAGAGPAPGPGADRAASALDGLILDLSTVARAGQAT